ITTRERNPHVPVTPDEIAADAVACLNAGASIIHIHNHDMNLCGVEAAAPYAAIAKMLLAERPDALWYPTNTHAPIPEHNSHLGLLVEQVPVHFGVLDPGSTNVGYFDDDGNPRGRAVVNDYDMIWHLAAELREWQLGASLAIHEPGYLRTTLALQERG